MYENIAARIPESVIKDIDFLVREEKIDRSKAIRELLSDAVKRKLIEVALDKYANRLISLGRAAELAKLSIVDFIKVAADRKVHVNYSLASLEADFKALK